LGCVEIKVFIYTQANSLGENLFGNVFCYSILTSSDPSALGFYEMKLLTNNLFFLVFGHNNIMVIEEVFIDGQNRDVWCNSKKTITESKMYSNTGHFTDPAYATTPSCYFMNYALATKMVLFLRKGSECLSSGTTIADFVLCE
jgi:hypothetical protein